MLCKNCGAELRENAKFCIRCGHPVEAAPIEADPVEPGSVDPIPPTNPTEEKADIDQTAEKLKAEFEEAPSAFAPKETPDPFKEEGARQEAPHREAHGQFDPRQEGPRQDGPRQEAVFCSKCGARNPAGAANCGRCGQPLSAAGAFNQFSQSILGQQIRTLVTKTLSHPYELCQEFRKMEYRRSNLFILLIKDVLLALFTAINMAMATSASNPMFGNAMRILGVDPVGIFFKFLIFMILFDAATIFAYFFAAKIFGSPISLYEWTGVVASVAFWGVLGAAVPFLLNIVRLGVLGSIFSGFAMLVSSFTILKAYMTMTDLEESRQIYSLVVATLFIGIFVALVVMIFAFMMASSAMGGLQDMYNPWSY